jgi:hypothetical protein
MKVSLKSLFIKSLKFSFSNFYKLMRFSNNYLVDVDYEIKNLSI